MNLIVEMNPDGCIKSMDGSRIMDAPATTWRMEIRLYGVTPVTVWEQMLAEEAINSGR